MLFQVPELEGIDLTVVKDIQAVRENLRYTLSVPRRWNGLLRRSLIGRAIRGSNSIEGYKIDRQDVVAAATGELVNADAPTMQATEGYRRAMTYMFQLANDPHFQWSEQSIKGLHYMMLEHELEKSPGQWRPGPIFVYDEEKHQQVYEGPDFTMVPDLMAELVESLADPDNAGPDLVRAAMAHLNLSMIHPFRDGNGRMARCLQTLVLGRSGMLEPPFSSIEEYLGVHQFPYYDVLTEVGKGSWHPGNNARSFVRFCLRAHYYQAHTLLFRIDEGGRIWTELEQIVKKRGLPERTALALWDATMGFRVVNATYRIAAEISQPVASRELTALANAGLLVARGAKRGRSYRAAQPLLDLRQRTTGERIIADPYASLAPTTPKRVTMTSPLATFNAPVMVPSSTGPKPPREQ